MIFKRWEPQRVPSHIALLLVVPGILSTLLLDHVPTVMAVVSTFLGFYATILTSMVSYRLSPWHPLAKYPGPILCKLSKFWIAHIARQGKQHLYMQNLHETYGDVVRIGK